MSEMKPVTVERAREALEDMDDYARMDAGVDAKGPRETLERFIADHERVVVELREKFDEQVQITARIANENASSRLRASIAEAALAELRAENERLRKSRNEFYHAAEGRRLANSDLRRRNAELQARVAELERFHDVVQTAMQIHVIDEDAIKWIEQQLAAMQGGEA